MRRPPTWALVLLAGAFFVSLLWVREDLDVGGGVLQNGNVTWYEPLLVVAILVLGRILLSFLPPSRIGSFRTDELGFTVVASCVLSLAALLAMAALFRPFGPLWAFAAAAAALVVFRWATLPGAMVPTHALPRARSGHLVLIVRTAWMLLAAWGVWHDPTGLSALLGIVAVDRGLAFARRDPLGRNVVLLALTSFLWVRGSFALAFPTLFLAPFGAACLSAWLRRADRRALFLCAISFPLGAPVGWAGLFALLVTTAKPARPEAARAAAIGIAAWWCLVLSNPFPVATLTSGLSPDVMHELFAFRRTGLLLVVVAAAGAVAMLPRLDTPADPIAARDSRREVLALAITLFGGVAIALFEGVAMTLLQGASPGEASCLAASLLPLAALFVGVVLVPPERPYRSALGLAT